MHRIFSGDGWLVFPDILKSARDHRPSQPLVQQPPVLIILCILCIDVPFIVLLEGSAPSRGAGARLAGKREFPKGDRPAFREVARRIPPTSTWGRPTRERGRPARMLSLRLPLSFPAMLQPTALPAGTAWARPKESHGAVPGRSKWGRWARLCQALCGRDARAPGKPSFHDIVTPRAPNCRSILAPLVVEAGPSVFGSIRVYWCPLVVRLH